jgi:hypothetical protein
MSCATFQRDQCRSKGISVVPKGSVSFQGDGRRFKGISAVSG